MRPVLWVVVQSPIFPHVLHQAVLVFEIEPALVGLMAHVPLIGFLETSLEWRQIHP